MNFSAKVIEPAHQAFSRGDDTEGVRAFARGVLGERYFEEMPEERKQAVWDNRSSARAQILGAGFPPLRPRDVRSVRAPTLLVSGQNSPVIMRRTTERLAELIPNAEQARIAGASHQMQSDNPSVFNDAVLKFLTRRR